MSRPSILGDTRASRRPLLTREQRRERRRLIAEHVAATGCTTAEAAKAFGVEREQARKACHEFGVDPGRPGRRKRPIQDTNP